MNAEQITDEMLDRDQVCTFLNISRRKLWELERAGKAPPRINLYGTVRFSRARLADYVRSKFEAAS